MTIPLDAAEVLDREFLDVRARLLHVAAALDRLGRAEGSIDLDPRLPKIHQALAILADRQPDRAERIQRLFSRDYDADWKTSLAMPGIDP
jgi:hypothetical protein